MDYTCACGKTWSSAHAFAGHTRWHPDCRWTPADIIDRNVDFTEDGCWIWTATSWPSGRTGNEYGALSHHGRSWKAHRWTFVVVAGRDLPEGNELDHTCLETLCVNPAHLEAVTKEEHDRRTRARKDEANAQTTTPDPF